MSEGRSSTHLTRVRCGKRVLIHADLLNRMASRLVERRGVSVISACACFTGYRPECTEELKRAGEL